MSIALQQQVKRMEQDLLELSRALTDSKQLIQELERRVSTIENRSKPGPKPRNG